MDLEQLRDWPNEIVQKLFDLVKPHRILYDSNDEQWQNSKLKGKTWSTIAKNLDPNLSSRRCRRKFVTLKRRFASEIKKQMAKGEANFDINLLWLLDHSDDIIDEGKENILLDLFKMEKNPDESLEKLLKAFEAQGSALQPTPSTSGGSASTTETDDPESLMRRQKRKNPAPKKIVSEEPAVKKAEIAPELVPMTAPRLVCPQPLRPKLPPPLSPPHLIPAMPPMAPKPTTGEQPLVGLPQLPRLVPVRPTISRASASYPSALSFPRPSRFEDQRMIEEECNTVGRLVELDLRRLRPENRAIARVAITRVIAELISGQVERKIELDLRRLRPENRAIARVAITRVIAELISGQAISKMEKLSIVESRRKEWDIMAF
uniref:MADF domain-containing protein n=1 Tax=Panagrolaimus sp. JU765 TaxID=591449 RepID=A0AC34PZR4_9BILA